MWLGLKKNIVYTLHGQPLSEVNQATYLGEEVISNPSWYRT